MRYVGVDPGLSGAIVALAAAEQHHTLRVADSTMMPVIDIGSARRRRRRELDVTAIVAWLQALGRPDDMLVAVEAQQAMPKQGVASTFRTGMGYGMLRGALLACAIPHVVVTAAMWPKTILRGCPGAGKGRAIAYVQARFPALDLTPGRRRKPHDGLADAACLAVYAANCTPRIAGRESEGPVCPPDGRRLKTANPPLSVAP